MRLAVMCAAWIGVAVFAAGEPLLAQLRDNSEKQMSCQNGGYDSDGVRHCEMREQTVPAVGRLSVDANRNGGGTGESWLRKEGVVRARRGFRRGRKSPGARGRPRLPPQH